MRVAQVLTLEDVMGKIVDFSTKHRTPVVFLIFPFFSSDSSKRLAGEYDKIVEMVSSSGLPYFLGENALEKPLDQYRIYPEENIHPNDTAHSLIATAFVDFLKYNSFFQMLYVDEKY